MDRVLLQRRLKRWFVRIQARLEAGVGDRWIPVLVGAVLIIILANFSLLNLYRYGVGPEVSRYAQAIWMIGEGKTPNASLFGIDLHILQLHWSFILYPLSVIGIWIDPVKVLLLVQAFAVGIAVVPLWTLARQVAKLRISAAACLLLGYSLHPATHRLAVQDFHLETLAIPVIIAMAYAGASKKWSFYWLCIALILLIRADLGLVVAAWGFVLLGDGKNRQGIRTLAVGLIWSLGVSLVVKPLFGQDLFRWNNSIFAEENVSLIVFLLVPVIFLPILSAKHFLPAIPLALMYLVAVGPLSFGDPSPFLLAFIMIASTYALNRLGNKGVDRVFTDGRLLAAFMAAAFLLYINSSPLSLYEDPWRWDKGDATSLALDEALQLIGPDDPVQASASALSALATRDFVYEIDAASTLLERELVQSEIVDFIVLVERDLAEVSNNTSPSFDDQAANLGFDLLYSKSGVSLYSRGEA